MPKLTVTHKRYDPDALAAWVARRRNALPFSARSADFVRLLKRKVRGRSARTHRFFGEAFVASQTVHREAYYGSFKWLTNPRFARDRKLAAKDQERFRLALRDHFGQKRIDKLQRVVAQMSWTCRKALARKSPTAPDLWLVDRWGHHRFIEVKLPGDSVAPHQLAGMAAIGAVLGTANVSVEVVHLNNEDRLFKEFCRAILNG